MTTYVSIALPNTSKSDLDGDLASVSAVLISKTPGRMRLRFSLPYLNLKQGKSLISSLKSRSEISCLRINSQTGSITIFYDPNLINLTRMKTLLSELGIRLKESSTRLIDAHQSQAAARVTATADLLNQQVKEVTQGILDLRFLIPFSFGILAIRQLLVKGIMLEVIPWYVLAWYSFDSFIKLHYLSDPGTPIDNVSI